MYSEKKLLNSLSGLPNDVKISNYKHVGDNILELFVDWEEPKLDERECPYCKGTYIIKKFREKPNSTPAIVRHVIDKIRLETPLTLPKSIGIDEFHGNTGHYDKPSKKYKTEKYHCVITDTDRSTVFDVIRNPKHKCLHEYFMTYDLSVRRCVRFVSLDMRSGFSKASRECFPNVKICIAHFM